MTDLHFVSVRGRQYDADQVRTIVLRRRVLRHTVSRRSRCDETSHYRSVS